MARTKKLIPILLPTKPVTSEADAWSLHVGHIKLFILGPGEDDWFPVSQPCYSGPVGSVRERRIAQAAVRLLNARHRTDRNLSKETFNAIYQMARKQTPAECQP